MRCIPCRSGTLTMEAHKQRLNAKLVEMTDYAIYLKSDEKKKLASAKGKRLGDAVSQLQMIMAEYVDQLDNQQFVRRILTCIEENKRSKKENGCDIIEASQKSIIGWGEKSDSSSNSIEEKSDSSSNNIEDECFLDDRRGNRENIAYVVNTICFVALLFTYLYARINKTGGHGLVMSTRPKSLDLVSRFFADTKTFADSYQREAVDEQAVDVKNLTNIEAMKSKLRCSSRD